MTANVRLQARNSRHPLWVFAYGSLMWRPDFSFLEKRAALLRGWHRAACIRSIAYRGTPECPGLVMGLDRGGACCGIAFHIAEEKRIETLDALDARELDKSPVYHVRWLPLVLDDGRRILAYGYTADRDHPQYAGPLSFSERARLVARGAGSQGRCRDYIASTLASLAEIGIRDKALSALLKAADSLEATQ